MEKITDRRAVLLALGRNALGHLSEQDRNCLDPNHPEPGINEVVQGSGKGNQTLDVHDTGSGSS